MGRLMAKTLLDMVNGRVPDPRHVVVETRLVVRDSA
jgi:DNA-binding LacI/PurR family transcriptional regulator